MSKTCELSYVYWFKLSNCHSLGGDTLFSKDQSENERELVVICY